MKLPKTNILSLDQFINLALYDKEKGYYMKKNPFGEDGDFITAPNITRLFSEIIAIWTITFWKSLGSPKKFNLLELGAGNGEMMKVIDETLINFPECYDACSFLIHEKSDFLIKEQKKNLNFKKFSWLNDIEKINSNPTIFLANEFFDAIPIKQFFKKKDGWFERFVSLSDPKKAEFKEEKIDIEKIEKHLNFEISKNQNVIEYSPNTFQYLRTICNLIQKNDGRKIWTLIMGGPTKYYDYSTKNMKHIFTSLYKLIKKHDFQLVVIPSMRTPINTIHYAKEFFGENHTIFMKVEKKAYLSALGIAENIIVTCDSSSMISEAALTGKPIYVANILPRKNDIRFQRFRNLFRELKIIRNLGEEVENWNYEKLDETNRVAGIIKNKIFS